MPINLASPGILVKEVDLTIGRVDSATDKNAAIVLTAEKGPVNIPIICESEQDLIDNFGNPKPTDSHYESWMVAASYLAYGGVLSVVRATDTSLKNATDNGTPAVTINSVDDYINKGYDESTITSTVVAARNPGSWANGLKVAIIDGKADQTLGVTTTNIAVGYGITQTAVGKSAIGAGSTSALDGYFKGIVTEVGTTSIGVKFLSHVSAAGVETVKDYQASGTYAFSSGTNVGIFTDGQSSQSLSTAVGSETDWFDAQVIEVTNGDNIKWNQIAERPGTSAYAAARNSRFDEVHVVVIDEKGTVSGNAGTILEKDLNVSKAKDAEFSAGSSSYWRKFIENNSPYIFGGGAPAGIVTTAFETNKNGTISGTGFDNEGDNGWDQNTQDIKFGAAGNVGYALTGGKNYDGNENVDTPGALTTELSGIVSGYQLFENVEEYDVDFLLMGTGSRGKEETQALANKIISVAEQRKDAVAFISPYRGSFIDGTGDSTSVQTAATITDRVVEFYSPITSSTYAVFDSGYKYMYDRFANTFRYVPLNGDIAGMCARNDINNFPWFSPAGTARGAVLNAIKLGYNPNQIQRDKLYTNRINPVIFSPGAGIVLFGDKTGFGKSSAFDRINVRRLFIYLEDAISAAAKDQLFEFNDEITRTNFVNIVEPFLRDVQAKRGITDFRVVCDETNNTGAVIDNNEFVADIFIKPARSINFIGLTFVATRTGISFEEVIGTV
jgi:hypothetical protein